MQIECECDRILESASIECAKGITAFQSENNKLLMADRKRASDSGKSFYCPECRKPMRRIKGKMGPFWGCTGFPKCTATLNDLDGKPSQQVDEHYRCPVCTRQLVRADKEKGDYWFCSGFSKGCKVTLADAGGVPETGYRCKACGQLLVRRERKDSKSAFWGCSKFPECRASYPDKSNKPNFDLLTSKNP